MTESICWEPLPLFAPEPIPPELNTGFTTPGEGQPEQVREVELNLLREITIGKGRPQDFWELSALLETCGLRDLDARNDWGEDDIFALARRLFDRVDELSYQEMAKKESRRVLVVRVLKNFMKGTVFALPMLLQIVSMVVIGFGLWSYIAFSLRQASAIALGTLLALASTGGIAQVIGRKGLYFLKMEQELLAAEVTRRLFLTGMIFIAVTGILFYLLNLYFRLFPADMYQLFICYYLLLSLVFLTFAIFYMFEAFVTIALLVLFGVFLTYLCFAVFRIGIVYSQYLSLSVVLLASIVLVLYRLNAIKKRTRSEGHQLPSAASLFHSLYPYFIFGTAYFLFIIMDRMLAWTAGKKFLPYFFWFNYPYEVGVDWALIPLVFTLALVEVFIYELGYEAFFRIARVPALEVKDFNTHFLRLYHRSAVIFAVFGVCTIVISLFFPVAIEKLGFGTYLAAFIEPIHLGIFLAAAISYVLLSWSLLNCITFFAYSRPEFALKSLGPALLVDFLVGYLCSRSFDYYYAVLGLLLGSVVFAVLSTYYGHKFFRKYDYYFYSTF
jgi:hypothetical protein